MVFPDTYNFNSASFFNGFVGDGGLDVDVVGGESL